VQTSDATREVLVRAMGFEADSEQAAARSLSRLGEAPEPRAPEPEGRCVDVAERLAGRSAFGIIANLYSVRSSRNWGFGQLGDLEELVALAAAAGAAFVGINPLHATVHRPYRFCPYDPVSRLFRDPLYLDPERVPELAGCTDVNRTLASSAWQGRVSALRGAKRLDVVAAEGLLFEVLRPLHREFRVREGDAAEERRGDFARYRAAQGAALDDFATFSALADQFEAAGSGRSFNGWPDAYRRPDAPAVRRFREQHAEQVEWHAWLQFELDRQLAGVARSAREAGLEIGLYTDLALGSSAGGSDVWSFPQLFARGVSVGAPPDAFSPLGQDWSFPPLDPHALERSRCAFWRQLLDANLRHAGALRLDHAFQLRRLFWIPEGAAPCDGAYVRYPTGALLAAAAEASHARDAVLIAEDLGTVPEGFSEELQARGLLTSRVLLFERDGAGFRPAASYPEPCLATANTHDLAPLAALDSDTDLVLRRRAGHIPDDAALADRRGERELERRLLVERLAREGFLGSEAAGARPDELAAAVTAFLCATPARLVGVALDDLAGEDEPINLPGVAPERHASWTRRMSASIADVFGSERARRALAAVPHSRRCPGFARRSFP
jgi:4-alpha-glucanotransferase